MNDTHLYLICYKNNKSILYKSFVIPNHYHLKVYQFEEKSDVLLLRAEKISSKELFSWIFIQSPLILKI